MKRISSGGRIFRQPRQAVPLRLRLVLLLLISFLALGQAAWAQTAAIEGTVSDPTGAAAPDASIEVLESRTGARRLLSSDDEGRFAALGLAPGDYLIVVSREGFQTLERRGVKIAAGRSIRLDLCLELGEQSESVIVEAAAPLVSASVAEWGTRISEQQLESLPLNGRDVFELATLEAGVNLVTSADRGQIGGFGQQIAVNGGRPSTNSFRLDGVYVNDSTNSVPVSSGGQTLGIESIEGLHLVTDPFSAEHGRASGATFTAVSKSGTNELHGSAYGYFRHSNLDAKNFFDSPDQPIPPLRRKQMGGMVGGPIRRDKVFYLVNYEGVRETLGATVRPLVPTTEARQGRLPAPGGGVAQHEVSPLVRPYLDLFPQSNGRDFGDGTAEYIHEQISETNEDYLSAKADWLLNERLRLTGRYTFDDGDLANPDPLEIWTIRNASRYQFAHVEMQQAHSPTTIAQNRAAYSRVANGELTEVREDIPASLSFVPGKPLGSLRVTGLEPIGGNDVIGRPRRFANQVLQLSSDLTHLRGRHTIKLGGGVYRIEYDQISVRGEVGEYRFGSYADFLGARVQRAEILAPGADAARLWRNSQFFGYAQDEIRFSPRLSLSLGLRYETSSTPKEADGKVATLRDPLHDQALTIGGPIYENPSKANFAPRAALAWDPFGTGTTVVRVGSGLFFDLVGSRHLALAGVRSPPFFRRLIVSRAPFPNLSQVADDPNAPAAIDSLQYDLQQPTVARWQLSVERQIGQSTVVRAGYDGLRGMHLMGFVGNANPVAPVTQPDGKLFFAAGGARLNPAFTQVGLRRPQFNSFYHGLRAGVQQRFSRFQFQANYTFSKSIDETSADVFTDFAQADRVGNPLNYRQNRGPSDFDIRHALSLNFNLELPDVARGAAGAALNGWAIRGITQIQSGSPFSPWIGFDWARADPGGAGNGQRPNWAVNGEDALLKDPAQWFDPQFFALPPAGYFGDVGRGVLRGPGRFTSNLAVEKSLWRTERQSILLRGEFFNLTNHPNFGTPEEVDLFNSRGGRLGSAGRITSTSSTSRQIQLALRWKF